MGTKLEDEVVTVWMGYIDQLRPTREGFGTPAQPDLPYAGALVTAAEDRSSMTLRVAQQSLKRSSSEFVMSSENLPTVRETLSS